MAARTPQRWAGSVAPRPIRGAIRRTLVRLLSRLRPVDTPRRQSTKIGESGRPLGLDADLRIAKLWLLLEQPARAHAWLRRGDDRSSADRLALMGQCLLAGIDDGVTSLQFLGVGLGRVAAPAEALEVFDAALTLEPENPTAQAGSTETLVLLGRFDEAEDRASTAVKRRSYLSALVREHRLRDAARLDQEQARGIISLLEDHVSTQPNDLRAQHRLANLCVMTGDFDGARAVASATDSEELLTLADWARLTFHGQYLEAHERKRMFAQAVSDSPPSRTATIGDFVVLAQAINYNSSTAAALEAMTSRRPFAATGSERQVLAKVRADLALLKGDPGALQRYRRGQPTPNPAAESVFRSMVKGNRVLVVGPSPTAQPTTEQIRAADAVAMTTSNHLDLDRSQPLITYVTDETAQMLPPSLLPTLNSSSEHLFVVRPSALRRSLPSVVAHPRVRTMQCEDATPFLGTHFGMQRILYDLIASGAGQIEIAGIDFFLGQQTYKDGYEHEQLSLPLMNFSHDYAYGFRYVQALMGHGLVRPAPAIRRILSTSVTAYLELLGRQQPDRPPAMAPRDQPRPTDGDR